MKKMDSLRAYLTAAIPELKADPARLKIFLDKGSLRSTGADDGSGRIAVEYRYNCTLLLLDFTGDDRALAIALMAWASVHQPELLQNFDRNRQGIAFEAEILDDKKVDLQIAVELTDAVVATPQGNGVLQIADQDEPPIAATAAFGPGAQAQMIGADLWPAAGPPTALRVLYAGDDIVAELPAA